MSGPKETSAEADDLDALMEEYEKQAARDCKAVVERSKKKRTAEQQTREDMHRPLSKDNRGYQLLAKLGYSEGQGLGTQKQGRSEPLPLPMKRRREGLGTVERKRPALLKKDRPELERAQTAAFRGEMSLRLAFKKTDKRLKAARHLIEDLDTRAGIERNPFWLPKAEVAGDNAEEHEDRLQSMNANDAFAASVAYLRGQHSCCFWCGHQYENPREMEATCPGLKEEDH